MLTLITECWQERAGSLGKFLYWKTETLGQVVSLKSIRVENFLCRANYPSCLEMKCSVQFRRTCAKEQNLRETDVRQGIGRLISGPATTGQPWPTNSWVLAAGSGDSSSPLGGWDVVLGCLCYRALPFSSFAKPCASNHDGLAQHMVPPHRSDKLSEGEIAGGLTDKA